MRRSWLDVAAGLVGLVTVSIMSHACAITAATAPDGRTPRGSIVFGRAVTVLLEESTRRYQPQVRFFELVNQTTNERVRVDLRSEDKWFALALPAGAYELSRVQISEGPFLSMADLQVSFAVGAESATYVGTWRFGIDSPRYERMVVVSAVEDRESRDEGERQILERYPDLAGQAVGTGLPVSASSESRLHEVMPYPYYPRYYRRHWW
jgi:hypothetical protein